jgi:hypothetical protein
MCATFSKQKKGCGEVPKSIRQSIRTYEFKEKLNMGQTWEISLRRVGLEEDF